MTLRSLTAGTLLLAPLATPAMGQAKPLPMASFIAERLIVLPVQAVRQDSLSGVDLTKWPTFRKELDDSLEAVLTARGIGRMWGYADEVVGASKRNPTYTTNPYMLGVQEFRVARPHPGDRVPPVLVSNLRAHLALGDTRYALIPVELAFERRGVQQRALLRLVLVDGRAGTVIWAGEVMTDQPAVASGLTSALANTLSARVADLAIAP